MSQPEFTAEVSVEATISASEDPLKVATAVGNVVGAGPEFVELGKERARLRTGEPKALIWIRDKLRDRHVRSAARRQLLLNKDRRSTSIMLNRQAAAAGVVALCGSPGESPLGPIYLSVRSKRLDAAIDWLTAYEEG